MAMLCQNLTVYAQENKAIDVTTKGIQIGQDVSDTEISNIHNYRKTSIKLSDLKGKLVILDFWATWCSPCVAMIPKMDSLQKQFGDRIQFLSVSYQTEKEVLPFLEKLQKGKPSLIPHVTGDRKLSKLFPHIYLPHYVWINGEGKVSAVTGYQEVNKAQIEKVLSGTAQLSSKHDLKVRYDIDKPFLIGNNGGTGEQLMFHSILTRFQEGIGSGYSNRPINAGYRLTAYNQSLVNLYALAFKDRGYLSPKRIECSEPELIQPSGKASDSVSNEWLKQHAYCYELIVPPALKGDMYEYMRRDLQNQFPQYKAELVKRPIKCLALERTSDQEKFKSKGGKPAASYNPMGAKLQNTYFISLILNLDMLYLQNHPLPVVDDTGYKGSIDLALSCKLNDLSDLNRALEPYDLRFIEKTVETDVLVVAAVTSNLAEEKGLAE
ncbi:hypothetical protein N824_10630 [Pedobacter sp. V48]|nr:hypothetical protein N824_10630 [Pedobacter sp. V48]